MASKQVVGLIGGIGSGKSAVAALFAERGARVISGDRLGHEALRQPSIRSAVAARWGADVLDAQGEVNRRKLGAIVFADPAQRRALEELVFPWIEKGFQEQRAEAEVDPGVALIVLDAAIMLEAGWNKICNVLVYVDVPRETRLGRLAEQRGWDPKEVEVREGAQMSLNDKRNHADYVVDNSGSLQQTAIQVDRLLEEWGIVPKPAGPDI